MAFAGDILDQDDFAGTDDPGFAVAGGQLDPGVEVDDVLPARRRVPRAVVFGLGLAEDDPVALLAGGGFAFRPLLRPIDLDVPPVRFAVGVAIQVVDMEPHRLRPYLFCQFGLRFSAKAFGPSM